MPNSTAYKLLEACREQGCPVCRLEQEGVERYLDNHFYENVNSPSWRERLRASLGFCHEHAWLGVEQRLGDALGYSIIYQDLIHTILKQLHEAGAPAPSSRRRALLLGPSSEHTRTLLERVVSALLPRQRCPVCEQRDEVTHLVLGALAQELETPEMKAALQASEGLCLPHLRLVLEDIKDRSAADGLLAIQRQKLEVLQAELAEFIRKSDYQVIQKGFGKEGNAWLRAVGMLTGSRKRL